MQDTIPRSFVNSVNNINPDANGNVAITFSVNTVNGQTGDTVVTYLYSQSYNLVMSLPDESDSYLHLIVRSPNYGATASGVQLFIQKDNGSLVWSWKNKAEGSSDIFSNIYDSNHQPPYPVISVNGNTGAV